MLTGVLLREIGCHCRYIDGERVQRSKLMLRGGGRGRSTAIMLISI